MRCQYCGKRLPLFRKLKDGEFCSAAHREQFLAQSDQLGLAALQEQRERSAKARAVPAPRASHAPIRESQKPATPDAAFCDRYLAPTVSAVRLGQLACMPLQPAAMAVQVLIPERAAGPYRAASNATWAASRPTLAEESVPAPQVLVALSNHGAPASRSPFSVLVPVTLHAADIAADIAAGVTAGVRSPDFGRPQIQQVRLHLSTEWHPVTAEPLAPEPGPTSRIEGWELPATAGAMVVPPAMAYAPTAGLLGLSGPPHLACQCLVWIAKRTWSLAPTGFCATGLAPLEAAAISPIAQFALASASVVRFPALVPNFSSMPVRRRPALALAAPAGPWHAFQSRQAEAAGMSMVPSISPSSQRSLDRARVALSDRLGILGNLHDLLEPVAGLAPPRRISWRHEAKNMAALHTLAVRHLPMDLAHGSKPAWRVRPLPSAEPKRDGRQIRLSAVQRPIQLPLAPCSESIVFHLEPKMMRPRLRAQPDAARQGLKRGRAGRNQGDAAVASIKIPILRRFWVHAPADIRWVALIIPLIFFLAWYSWTPHGKALNQQGANADLAVDTSGVETMFAAFKARISSRAAIELSEDFRAGLSEWQGSREDWATNWSYDQAGFVRPGNLAILTPSLPLTDYNFEFMGQIENRALNWVYRAKDHRNYYLGRLVIGRNGPIPEVAFVRSVVKNGKESHRKVIALPMNLRSDTLYRVRVDVNGSDFTTSVLGQVVDTFTDAAHPQGGIGFYGGYGETGRVRWVEVSHQYDTLGRLCAMLVPYGVGSATAQAKSVSP